MKLLAWLIVLLATGWGGLALWFDGPNAAWLAGLLAFGFAAISLAGLLFIQPFSRALLVALVLFSMLFAWWSQIPPRHDRDWLPDVARLPYATFQDSLVTIHNLRNFAYRSETDYIERWQTQTFDLDTLQGVDLFLSFWGPTLIAHTITSWEFADGSHLAISIETRKEKGESYSAIRGFFRQYELYYVVADERDVIGLRTNHRNERVYLYRTRMPPDRARDLLLDYLKTVNQLAKKPRWYNALTYNCTTAIRYHVQQVAPGNPWDWRILVNGYADELAYERGMLNTRLPFAELRQRSDITAESRAAEQDPAFSRLIRRDLPPREP